MKFLEFKSSSVNNAGSIDLLNKPSENETPDVSPCCLYQIYTLEKTLQIGWLRGVWLQLQSACNFYKNKNLHSEICTRNDSYVRA